MCVIYLSFRSDRRYPLVVAANRDEFHERPTAPLSEWDGGIVAGRDLRGGGTWMGLHRSGRFAALTNFREPSPPAASKSRGTLVTAWLRDGSDPERWVRDLATDSAAYGGFSLFVSDLSSLAHVSNRGGRAARLDPGVYAIGNGLLGDPWPKVLRGKEAFERALESAADPLEPLLSLLADSTPSADGPLPETGIGPERERALSPIFIRGDLYGTRASSVVLVDPDGHARLVERSFGPGGTPGSTRSIELALTNDDGD
ncbi:MAG TPA: NRDE family protein [Thermoanaerobaculia bacterium]|nr:NRDE family protein [Thermoanaerobaculia bacterium]